MKQQDEIAALNRAQEKAEARVSSIHQQLTASESELGVLEGEMDEVWLNVFRGPAPPLIPILTKRLCV